MVWVWVWVNACLLSFSVIIQLMHVGVHFIIILRNNIIFTRHNKYIVHAGPMHIIIIIIIKLSGN